MLIDAAGMRRRGRLLERATLPSRWSLGINAHEAVRAE
jgi:hypothetical protein